MGKFSLCVRTLVRLKQAGVRIARLPANVVKHIAGELWEVRPEYGGIEYRFFFFVSNNRIGVVSAIIKKRQLVERKVILRALRLASEMQQQWQVNEHE